MKQKLQKFLLGIGLMSMVSAVVGQPYDPDFKKAMQAAPKSETATADLKKVNQKFAQMGLRFTENKGQVTGLDGKPRPDVLFIAENDGVKLFLTEKGIHYQFKREYLKQQVAEGRISLPPGKTFSEIEKTEFYRLDLGLKGANPNPKVIAEGIGQDVENFFLAHAPQGITGVRNFSKVIFKEVYPNIDWVVYTKGDGMEYDFIVRPGGKVSDIKLDYENDQSLAIQEDGSLKVITPLGSITEDKPFSFQEPGKEIKSRFVLTNEGFGFEVPDYNANATLVIDPGVDWATYYGGNNSKDFASSLATDKVGNVYMAGTTFSNSGIAESGHQNTIGGNADAFLVKFNSAGQRLWASYYGGSAVDSGYSVSTDTFGNIYLAGVTFSSNGISYNGHQALSGGASDGFLVKFNNDGVRLWSSYYGGTGNDRISAITTSLAGDVFIAGRASSASDIAVGGYMNSFAGGGSDAFLVKFNSAGVRQWGTYYGGSAVDYSNAISTDLLGNVYIAGTTYSVNGIGFNGHKIGFTKKGDAFLAKFDSLGVRKWGTYYGGSEIDEGNSVGTDRFGNVILAGTTLSLNGGIATPGSYKPALVLTDTTDGFLVKFDGNGIRSWATYFGGDSTDYCSSVATDSSGNIYITGLTRSSNFSANDISFGRNFYYKPDAFFARFSRTGTLVYRTTYGDNGFSRGSGEAVATDTRGNVYFAGNTINDYLPAYIKGLATENSFRNSANQNDFEAFLVKISETCTQKWYSDLDADGYSDLARQIISCDRPVGFKLLSELLDSLKVDCDDYNPIINPGAPEICNGMDDNCDGMVDEGFGKNNYYSDNDNDRYVNFNFSSPIHLCYQPLGWTIESQILGFNDCDDNDPAVFPGVKIRFYKDNDKDGYPEGVSYWSDSCYIPGFIRVFQLKDTTIDCNDNDTTVNPAALEFCRDGIDNNCNGIIDEIVNYNWYRDRDNDGFSTTEMLINCRRPFGYKLASELKGSDIDCNDFNAKINPGAVEVCGNGIDENCNGLIDEVPPTVWFKDADGDKYAAPNATIVQCTRPRGYISEDEVASLSLFDCRDSNPSVNPDANEIAGNGIDENCNEQTDESYGGLDCAETWYRDADGDGYGNNLNVRLSCKMPSGFVDKGGDCNDSDSTVYPLASEICDGKDNNCDGKIDEGIEQKNWYPDRDGDGFGRNTRTIISCKQPASGWVTVNGDCNDLKANVYPGSTIGSNCGVTSSASGVSILSGKLVDLNETSATLTTHAFPNPHDGSFIIEVQSPAAGKGSIVLYDLQGRTVATREEQLQKGTNQVRFSNLKRMNYMYRVMVNGQSTGGKILSVN